MKRLLVCLLLVGVVGCWKSESNKAISKPDKAEAERNKGVDVFDLKGWATAIACYNEAIRINPDYAAAYNNRGYAYALLKEYDTAIAD
jgi:tetratricopeptide (TPR) repeat protein